MTLAVGVVLAGIAGLLAHRSCDQRAGTTARAAARSEVAQEHEPFCDHPFVPLAPGTRSVYRLQTTFDDRVTMATSTVLTRGRIHWRAEGPPPARTTEWTVRVRCDDEGVEEPWFGLLSGMLGLWSDLGGDDRGAPFVLAPHRWKLPRALPVGREIHGQARVERLIEDVPLDATFRVRYRVEEPEAIELYDGRSHVAHRLSFTEQQSTGEHEGEATGEIWLVPEMGLVRMHVSLADHSLRWDLIRHEPG